MHNAMRASIALALLIIAAGLFYVAADQSQNELPGKYSSANPGKINGIIEFGDTKSKVELVMGKPSNTLERGEGVTNYYYSWAEDMSIENPGKTYISGMLFVFKEDKLSGLSPIYTTVE